MQHRTTFAYSMQIRYRLAGWAGFHTFYNRYICVNYGQMYWCRVSVCDIDTVGDCTYEIVVEFGTACLRKVGMVTVAILAQGTSRAVAATQAFCLSRIGDIYKCRTIID